MRKAAIVIGVNKTGKMPLLNAAVKGANAFEHWASSHGYDVISHTDDTKDVTVADIKKSVKSITDAMTYEQLIIFFSGHGILRSSSDELWLLSGSPTDPDEAISLFPCQLLAREVGIPHVIFISDACRSIPNDRTVSNVRGSVIFVNTKPVQKRPKVDIFYATNPGNPAFEVAEDEAVTRYDAVFTKVLLAGLKGNEKTISKFKAPNTQKEINVVFAQDLWTYLEEEVPAAAAAGSVKQFPDAIVTSVKPYYISEVNEELTEEIEYPEMSPDDEGGSGDERGEDGGVEDGSGEEGGGLPDNFNPDVTQSPRPRKTRGRKWKKLGELLEKAKANEEVKEASRLISQAVWREFNKKLDKARADTSKSILESKGRESFETQTGFTIVGAKPADIFSFNNLHDPPFNENDSWQIRVRDSETLRTLLLQLTDGSLVPLAVLKGFIGTVLIADNKVVNINYTPSKNSPKFQPFVIADNDVRERRANIMASVQYGKFQLANLNQASYLREQKALDPILGLFAAYAYQQQDFTPGIESVLKYMMEEPEPVIFDVYSLANFSNKQLILATNQLAPFCPILTQGWSFVSVDPTFGSAVDPTLTRELSCHLKPGLWTTFDAAASNILIDRIKKGKIK